MRRHKAWSVVVAVAVLALAADARAAPVVKVGPVLAKLRPDAITVVIGLDQAAPIDVEVTPSDGPTVRAQDGSKRWHEVTITGLSPDTAHDYVVRVGSHELARGSFTTAPPDGADVPVRFLVYGDTRDDQGAHAEVARAMADETADFVLHTGDLVGDARIPSDWAAFFAATRHTFDRLPFFSTIGNHEALDDDAVARYLAAVALPGNELYYRLDHGPIRVLVLDSNEPLSHHSAQRHWLDAELADARRAPPRHLFVLIHAGPFSSGYHGENARIRHTDVEAALRRAHVELIFEGHDHAYERGEDDGLKYVLSGGGGAPVYVRNSEQPYQLAFLPEHHYVRVDVRGDKVRVVALDPDGDVLDACGYTARGPWECVGGPGRGRGRVVVRGSSAGFGRGAMVLAAVAGAGFAAWSQRKRRA